MPLAKKKDTPTGVFLFGAALLLRKSGRLRAGDLTCKGNPTKVSPAYIPFLAIYRSVHGQQNLWAITKKDFKRTNSHQRHAEELTGLTGDEAWEKYEEMADEFLKKEIDGEDMEGFVSEGGWLFKFQHSTGLFGILSDKGTISTLYIPDEKICKMTPEEYWKEQIRKYGKEP